MSNYLINISGCLKLNDYNEAIKWLARASDNLDISEYKSLIVHLIDQFPQTFKRQEFAIFKSSIKSPYEIKTEIERALKSANYQHAQNLYQTHFTYESYPEFITLLNEHKKQNPINSLDSTIRNDLSGIEKELEIDTFTYLEHLDKPFFRRIQTKDGNFYITKDHHPDLSTIKGRQTNFARHLPWHHPLSRDVLSTELGEIGRYGLVSLIGDYKPDETDLKDVSYFTSNGRSFFSSAIETLTNNKSSTIQKIDADNFMRMKEVIPTASQMKAIYATGNYIIDGPAGTGKSTTLLQKILILTTQHNIKTDKVLVLVKHHGLINPFKKLLTDMGINGVNIDSVEGFLESQIGSDLNQLSLELLDDAEASSNKLNNSLKTILYKKDPIQEDINILPDTTINKPLIIPEFTDYCELTQKITKTEFQKSEHASKIMGDIEKSFDIKNKMLVHTKEQNSLEKN